MFCAGKKWSLTGEFKLGEGEKAKTYPAGSIVVRMDQPYRTIAKTLLEIQKWPAGDATNPYDATGWTLGLMMGVKTVEIGDKSVLEAAMEPIGAGDVVFKGRRSGESLSHYTLVPPQGTAMIHALVALEKAGIEADVADAEFSVGDKTFPAGTFVLEGEEAARICEELNLSSFAPGGDIELPELRAVKLPRIAMYHTWFNTQESGWTRYTFEQDNVQYTLINKDRVRRGDLLADFDVIVIPHQGGWGSGARILRGIETRFGPLAYNKTDEFKYMGFPDATDDISGGLGLEGALELEKFVRGGGTLITLGTGSSLVTDLGFLRGVSSSAQPRTLAAAHAGLPWYHPDCHRTAAEQSHRLRLRQTPVCLPQPRALAQSGQKHEKVRRPAVRHEAA